MGGWSQPIPFIVQTYPPDGAIRRDTLRLSDTAAARHALQTLISQYHDRGYVRAWGHWQCGPRQCRGTIYPGRPIPHTPSRPFSRLRRIPHDTLRHYVTHGHPFAAATIKIKSAPADSLHFVFDVRPGTYMQWDALILPDPIVHGPTLERMLGYRRGSPFSPHTIDSVQEALARVPWLRLTAAPHVLFVRGKAHMYLPLTRTRQGWADGLLSFQRTTAARWLLTGRAEAAFHNLFRRFIDASFRYLRQDRFTRFQATASVPYIAATPWGLQGAIRTEQQDSAYLTQQSEVSFTYHRGLYRKLGIGLLTSRHTTLSADSIHTIRKRWSLFHIQWDGRFNPWEIPRRSYRMDLSLRSGKAAPAYRIYGRLHYYFPLMKEKWETGLTAEIAFVRDTPLTLADAFTLGGIDHLPGFPVDEIKATTLATAHMHLERQWGQAFALGAKAYAGILREYADTTWDAPHGIGLYLRARRQQIRYTIGYFIATRRRQFFAPDRSLVHVRFQYLIP